MLLVTAISLLLIAGRGKGIGQSTFDPAAYKAYLESNQNLTTSQLLERNPAQTTYYSTRTYPADLEAIPWFDSIDRVFQLSGYERELLSNNYFVVSQRLNSFSWLSSLIQGYNMDLPLFLSADFVLFSLHNSYDNILMTLEQQLLETNLMELLGGKIRGRSPPCRCAAGCGSVCIDSQKPALRPGQSSSGTNGRKI